MVLSQRARLAGSPAGTGTQFSYSAKDND